MPGIISGYMAGLRVVFILMTVFGGMAFLLSMLQSWKRIKSISKAPKAGKADNSAAEKAEAGKAGNSFAERAEAETTDAEAEMSDKTVTADAEPTPAKTGSKVEVAKE